MRNLKFTDLPAVTAPEEELWQQVDLRSLIYISVIILVETNVCTYIYFYIFPYLQVSWSDFFIFEVHFDSCEERLH